MVHPDCAASMRETVSNSFTISKERENKSRRHNYFFLTKLSTIQQEMSEPTEETNDGQSIRRREITQSNISLLVKAKSRINF